MFERFTKPARAVVESATTIATSAGASETRPDHLLQALLVQEGSMALRVLAAAGAPAGTVSEALTAQRRHYVDGLDADDAEALATIGIDLDEVVRRIDRDLGGRGAAKRRPRFSRGAKKTLELSLREALDLGHNYLGSEHLLLGLARGDDRVVSDTLRACGLELSRLRQEVVQALAQAG